MGVKHVAWANYEVRKIPLAAKAVLGLIADHANADDEAWPSYSTIADHLNISEKSVQRHVNWLVTEGALTKVVRSLDASRKKSNLYRLNMNYRGSDVPSEGGQIDHLQEGGQIDQLDSRVHLTTLNQESFKKEEEESAPDDLEEKFQELVDIFEPGPTEDLAHGRVALANLQAFERSAALKHAARFVEALRLEKRKQISIANYLSRKRWESVERYTPRPVKAGEGKPTVWLAKGSPGWEAWAKFKGKPLACIRSSEHREDGFYFVSAMPPAMVT